MKTAVKWFRKAADAGDGDAVVQPGIHYYRGTGIEKNSTAAVQRFRMATKAKDISWGGKR